MTGELFRDLLLVIYYSRACLSSEMSCVPGEGPGDKMVSNNKS